MSVYNKVASAEVGDSAFGMPGDARCFAIRLPVIILAVRIDSSVICPPSLDVTRVCRLVP